MITNPYLMTRFIALLSVILAGTVAANAGQIQIGGMNGLTDSYLTAGGTANGNTGGATENNYDVNLFANALNGATAPQPYAGYSTSAASGGTITDANSGIVFNMVNDGLDGTGSSSNFWMLNSTNNPTMTIPIGIFGVSNIWTLLNSMDGSIPGARDENITFIFGTTATGGTLTNVGLKLQNSGNGSPSGQIQNALSCPSSSACSNLSNSHAAPSSSLTSSSGTGLTAGMPVTVMTDTVFSSTYSDGATGAYAGTAGSLGLEDEGFIFTGSTLALAATEYLVAIQIKETAPAQNSALGISAITVDPSTAPEPKSALLLLGGLGAMGIALLRTKRRVLAKVV